MNQQYEDNEYSDDEQYSDDEPQKLVVNTKKSIIKKPFRQPAKLVQNQQSEEELLRKLVQELMLSQKQPRTRLTRTEKVQQQQQPTPQPKNKKALKNIGTREEVFNNIALQTSGGLKKTDLMINSKGMIVSKLKSLASKQLFNRQ